MTSYLLAFALMMAGFLFLGLTLHFAGYKKDGRCCSDGIDFHGDKEEDCETCPNREAETCELSKLIPAKNPGC